MVGGLSDEKIADLRVAHLNIIQGIVARLSGYSANAKNFSITITAALTAVIFDKELPDLAWVAFAVILVFLFIDCYYLGLERQYRRLYRDVCNLPIASAVDFSTDVRPLSFRQLLSPIKSTSIWPFYAALLAGMIYFGYCSSHGKQRPESIKVDRSTAEPKQPGKARTANEGGKRAVDIAK